MKNKSFTVHIEFNAFSFQVKAKTKSEAKSKIINKLSKRDIRKLIDHKQSSVENY